MDKVIPFCERLRQLLAKKWISTARFEAETKMSRRLLYTYNHRLHKSTLMALAYYLDMDGEELVAGTDAEEYWY